MASPLPVFKEACLAPDHSFHSVYIIGSSNPGTLDVYYLNLADISYAIISLKTQEITTKEWDPNLPKYCFSPPDQLLLTSVGVTAIQLGDQGSNTIMAAFGKGGTPGSVAPMPGIASATTKAFTLSGVSSRTELFSVYTKNYKWVGLRIDLDNPTAFSISPTLNISSSETPMVAVGTHSFSFGNKTEGYSVVFNNGTGGTVYKATGDAATLDKNNMLVLEQKESYKLDMNNIQLTNYSVPVTMSASISDTAYILDKSKSTIVIYTFNPSSYAKKLEEVIVSGDIPQYSGSGSLVATSVAKSIVVYSLTSDSVPRVHVFDTESKKWSMAVVQSGPRQMEKSTLGYVFSIVGWSVAALIVVFLIKKFWYCFEGCFRCLKRRRKNTNESRDAEVPAAEESLKPQHKPLEESPKPQQKSFENVNQHPDPASPFPQHMGSPYPSHTVAPLPLSMAAPFPEPTADPYASQIVAPFPGQPSSPFPQHVPYSPQIEQYVANSNSFTMMGPGEQSNGILLTQPYWPTQTPPSPLPSSADQYTSSNSQYPPTPRFQPSPYP